MRGVCNSFRLVPPAFGGCRLRGCAIRPKGPPSPEFCQFLQPDENYITTTSSIFRSEISLFHCGLRLAGQVDCLCQGVDGSLILWDWKAVCCPVREGAAFPGPYPILGITARL